MNPFFVVQMIRNLLTGESRRRKPRPGPDYTGSKYYRGQDYDDHVYDRGEDCGLGDCGDSKKERSKAGKKED
mgnify:CR=1 FL=1